MHYLYISTTSLKILSVVLPLTFVNTLSKIIELSSVKLTFDSLLFLLIVPITFSLVSNYIAFIIQKFYTRLQ